MFDRYNVHQIQQRWVILYTFQSNMRQNTRIALIWGLIGGQLPTKQRQKRSVSFCGRQSLTSPRVYHHADNNSIVWVYLSVVCIVPSNKDSNGLSFSAAAGRHRVCIVSEITALCGLFLSVMLVFVPRYCFFFHFIRSVSVEIIRNTFICIHLITFLQTRILLVCN